MGLIHGQGVKIPCAVGPRNQNIKQKHCCNKFSKDFKNGPQQKILKKKKNKDQGDKNHAFLSVVPEILLAFHFH